MWFKVQEKRIISIKKQFSIILGGLKIGWGAKDFRWDGRSGVKPGAVRSGVIPPLKSTPLILLSILQPFFYFFSERIKSLIYVL